MGSALFYHLTRSPAEQLLPTLLGKSLQAGWRVELRGTDRARMERLDELLWEGEGFLPHGLAGGAHDARQPVLLTTGPVADGRDCLITIDGAAVDAAACAGLARLCILFDGQDQAAVGQARDLWRALAGAGLATEYWSDQDGRWARKR